MNFDIDTFGLNESQRDAVLWETGPVLVLAGPGSGKTRVLTCRIARLIAASPDARFRVLGVTFTNKAAGEMRQRIDAMLVQGRDRVTLTTFHSFAAEILRQHGSHSGLSPDFSILTEQADREEVLTDAIKAVVTDDSDFIPKAGQLLPTITRMLDECVPVNQAETSLADTPHATEIAAIYKAYRERLIGVNQLDFASLLAIAVDLLESKPAIAKQCRRVYTHVCVDECQDTNSAQFRLLVQLVTEAAPNLFVVADDDQVLYQWNGASPDRLRELRDRYDMPVIQLPENYRCPPIVIQLANSLIAHNTDRSADKKPLTAHKPGVGSEGLIAQSFADFSGELSWIAKTISEKTPDERKGCVILARRKKLLDDAVQALTAQSVPAYIAVRKNEFESAPYRLLHATLRLANAPTDKEQLRRMTKAFFDLEGIKIEVQDVIPLASVSQEGYLRAWLQLASQRTEVSPVSRDLLEATSKSLAERMDYWKFIAAAHQWFEQIKNQPSGSMSQAAFQDFEDEQEIWTSLRADISQHYDVSELSLHNFLQELDLRAKEKPAPANAVRCLTIASSKGMEFKHVYVIGLVEDELPGYYARKAGDSSDEMREERRNCFVAITRAEESLTLTFSARYFGYGKAPSRFLKEMGFKLS
ncbi:AAA family ATPase [bacterium]|nr:AAA family ATPase [bacterium]